METVKQPIKKIDKFLTILLLENHRIFGSALTNEKVANFYHYYTEAVKREAITALQEGAEEITLWTGPVKGRTEPKTRYALIAAGISADGKTPNGEEYSYAEFVFIKSKIEDFLIREHEIITTIEKATKIINRLKDKEQAENLPSYMEILDLLIKANNIKACNKPVPEEFKEDFEKIKPIYEKNLDLIFQISIENLQTNENYHRMVTPHILEYCRKNKTLQIIDKASAEVLKTLVDIESHLYHPENPTYNNIEEYSKLKIKIKAIDCLDIVLDSYICPVLSELNAKNPNIEEKAYVLKK